jgi:hypothetical protein
LRRDQKKILYIGIGGGVGLIAISILATALIFNGKMNTQEIASAQALAAKDAQLKKISVSSRNAIILIAKKEAGQVIMETDIKIGNPPDAFTPADVITDPKDVLGKTIKLTSEVNTPLTTNMLYAEGPLDPSARVIKTDYVEFEDNIITNDKVDVRILFPDGEDFIVLSKKKMDFVDYGVQGLSFKAIEGEIQLLNSALVDAYVNSAEIYVSKYTDPEMQEAPNANYVPNINVMNQMRANPGIVNKAHYVLVDILRKSLDDNMKKLDPQQKIHLGATLPVGSAVANKKRTTVGVSPTTKPAGTTGTNSQTGSTVPSPAPGVTNTTPPAATNVPKASSSNPAQSVPASPTVPKIEADNKPVSPDLLGGK